MDFALWPSPFGGATVQYAVRSTQKFVPNDGWGNCADGSWATKVGGPKRGGGQGTGCEAPTVQMAMIRAGYPMVGRSFGRDLAEACTVRRSLCHTQEFVPNDLGLYRWACAVGCVQWVDPTGQLAQFGTKRAKKGAGVRAFGPLWGLTMVLLS